MMKLRWSTTVLAALLWAGSSGIMFGQSTNSGDISGIVSDSTGAAVPGVTVTVANINTGVSKVYITNNDGVYDTSSIVTGTYKITFAKSGFSELVRSSVTIVEGSTTINAQLGVGAVTEQVVVNTDDKIEFFRKKSNRLAADKAGRACDQCNIHKMVFKR